MAQRLIIATANSKKFAELKRIIENNSAWEVIIATQADPPFRHFPPETGMTFADNARIKSEAVALFTGQWVLADDSGLVVPALNGQPGIFSARYGGEGLSDRERAQLLLQNMENANDRAAYFEAALSLSSPEGKEFRGWFGRLHGEISRSVAGEQGFGYDPIFIPKGQKDLKTLAEMEPEVKDKISHRAKALQLFLKDLNDLSDYLLKT